ncbi:methyltransferase domain-containing protein [Streptomyces sp. NPDC047971]|uniref:methyltransferase domain-containing protein n=1 Tax=Streptomyces sp. NPDC047971 TaxID=3154499 RepID=UPI003404501C
MGVVVVRDPATETPAAVRTALAEAGLAIRPVPPPAGESRPPDLSGVEGIVVLAAPRREATAEQALLRGALAADVPVLALGPGTELLAGADAVGPPSGAPRPPGHGGILLTPAADTDPLFADSPLPPELPPADGPFAPPVEAVTLAVCDGHPQQAFRLGVSAWGVRFLTGTPLDAWGERLLRRFAALVAARAEHTATRAFFTHRAGDWEERFTSQGPAYEAAVARMRLAPGSRALDLGCGTGRAMPALRAHVGAAGHVLGVDVTPAMLASAARHARDRHGHLLAADCNLLPLPGRCVHGIFSAGLLDHLPDPRAALVEWARVSAGNAVLLLFHPSGRAERAARHGRPLDPDDLLAESNLRPALEATGWRVDEYEDAPHHFLARAVLRS